MSFELECRKIKRTGLVPAFIIGGILAAALPLINMAVRWELFTGLPGTSVKIMLDENWQMMAMLNILLISAGACLLYHTEYAQNAMQKMCTLPMPENRTFFGKALLLAVMGMLMLVMEAAAVFFGSMHWFGNRPESAAAMPADGKAAVSGMDGGQTAVEVVKNFGYAFFLMIPAVLLFLCIASAFQNMWICLGISLLCIFTAMMLPTDRFFLSCFPFALPFQIFADSSKQLAQDYLAAAFLEAVFAAAGELLFLRARRRLS